MAKSLNLCQFIGNLGKAPEVTAMPNGGSVAKFSIACADDYKDANGNKVEQTNWIRCVAFGRLADVIGQYCRQGSKVYVSGKQVTREWTDNNSQKRFATEIVLSELQMLDSKPQDGGQQRQAPAAKPQQAPKQNQQTPTSSFSGFDDDIDF